MIELNENLPHLFIKANTQEEYKALCTFLEDHLPLKLRQEKFKYDHKGMIVNIYLSYPELRMSLRRFSACFFDYHVHLEEGSFPIQFSEYSSAEEKKEHEKGIQRFIMKTL